MTTIGRVPRQIPVPITRTSGLFHLPSLKANELKLRVYLSNFDKTAASTYVTLNQADAGRKNVIFRTNLLVASMGTAVQELDIADKEGFIVEVELVLSSNLVKPSLAVVEGSEGGCDERTVLFLPPSAFSMLKASQWDSR